MNNLAPLSQPSTAPCFKFLFTLGTGSVESSSSLLALSPRKLHRMLTNEHKGLQSWWLGRKNQTFGQYEQWVKRRPHIKTIFPHIIPGIAFDDNINLVVERDTQVNSIKLSGLILLSFNYFFHPWEEREGIEYRKHLWDRLLATPLLGPSVVIMFRELERSKLHILVAVGTSKSYPESVKMVVNYIKATHPKLGRSMHSYEDPNKTCWVGSDPLACIQREPVGGYPVFPAEKAQPIIRWKNGT